MPENTPRMGVLPMAENRGIAIRPGIFLESAMRKPTGPSSKKAEQLSLQEKAVLNLIETGLATSQVELVTRCNLSPTTISGIVNRLVAKLVIEARSVDSEDGTPERRRGRPQVHFEVPKRRAVVLITLGGSILQAQAFHRGQAASPLEETSFPLDTKLPSVIEKISELHHRVVRHLPKGRCDYLALTKDGNLDKRGFLQTLPFKPWLHGISVDRLGSELRTRCETPIIITTSSHAPMLLGEFRALRSLGVTRICELIIGDGVSSATADLAGFWGTATHYRGNVSNLAFWDEENPFGLPGPPNLEDLTCGYGLLKWIERQLPRYPNSPLAQMLTKPPAACYARIEELHQAQADPLAIELGERFLRLVTEALRIINTLLEPDIIILNGYALLDRPYWKQRLIKLLPERLNIPDTAPATIMDPNMDAEATLKAIVTAIAEPTDKSLKTPSGVLIENLPGR